MATISYGPTITDSGANVTGIGTIAWGTPGNVTADDSSYATLAHGSGSNTSNYLYTTCPITVPSDCTILGVQIDYKWKASTGSRASDNVMQLTKDGTTTTGTNQATSTTIGTTETTRTFGGSANLMGATLSPADVNNSAFGALLATRTSLGATTVSVNCVTWTVTTSSGIYTATSFFCAM